MSQKLLLSAFQPLVALGYAVRTLLDEQSIIEQKFL